MTLLDGELDLELDTGAKNFSRIGPEKVARRYPSCAGALHVTRARKGI
jgi:hypothetical protein